MGLASIMALVVNKRVLFSMLESTDRLECNIFHLCQTDGDSCDDDAAAAFSPILLLRVLSNKQ